MGTNCTTLVPDLFCYERDLMMTLFEEKQSEVIEAFSLTSRYLDDLFNIGNDMFVCVEVLRPSQPNGVMSSAVSLPNHTFTGQT